MIVKEVYNYEVSEEELKSKRSLILPKVLKTELEKHGYDYRENTDWFEHFKDNVHYRVRVKNSFVVVSPVDCIISRDQETADILYTRRYKHFLNLVEYILSSI